MLALASVPVIEFQFELTVLVHVLLPLVDRCQGDIAARTCRVFSGGAHEHNARASETLLRKGTKEKTVLTVFFCFFGNSTHTRPIKRFLSHNKTPFSLNT